MSNKLLNLSFLKIFTKKTYQIIKNAQNHVKCPIFLEKIGFFLDFL